MKSLKPRERRLFGFLLVVGVAFALRYTVPMLYPEDELAAARAESRRRAITVPEVATLRLEALDGVAGEYRPGRNPFQFGTPPPPPPPTREELEAAARRAAEEAALRAQIEAERLRYQQIPRPPEFTLRYLGNFGPANRRIAVFSDGQGIYNAFEGDVLEGRFKISRIGYESVEIRYVDFPDAPPLRVAVSG